MGAPLVQQLAKDNTVYVTSRAKRDSTENIKYIQGSAKEKGFLMQVLTMLKWDAIIDFMIYSVEELRELAPTFLENTKQYVFISSSRVYSQTENLITENTPRLLEASTDKEYLKTNEYALAKAREEDIFLKSEKNNFTIIRPTITYNTYRLQLGVLEKEGWLYRALKGRSIVFSKDIYDKLTTMTLGNDVSTGIASVIGKKNALGEVFHITCPTSLPWSEVLSTYKTVLEEHLGMNVPIVLTEKSTNLKFKWRVYQVIYSRYFNRTFDNSKIGQYCDISGFTEPHKGLAECLAEFLKHPKFGNIEWDLEAINDRVAGEHTPLSEIPSFSDKIRYFCYRHNAKFLLKLFEQSTRILRKIKNINK